MEQFIALLVDNIDIVLSVLVGFLCFLVTWFRTGSLKKAINKLKEYEDMIKYRTASEAMEAPWKGQEFSDTAPDFILNPATNQLEKSPIDRDIQAQIQSYVDVALDRALEKFLPQNVVDSNEVATYEQHVQDLAVLGDALSLAEDYRDRYHLSESMSAKEIFDYVGKQADGLKEKLTAKPAEPAKEVSKDVEKKETV